MNLDIALILSIDGLANGAVYLLAGLGLVLLVELFHGPLPAADQGRR